MGFFHANISFLLAGVIGVFLALDLFLFYFFWELMLIPMFFLIIIWGDENRRYAATKFFIFTQLSSLLMLISILGLHFMHARNTGHQTFDYAQLLNTAMAPSIAFWLLLGFVAAFFVKLPTFPLHTWLPDAYASAPTAGSVLLAGLLSKTAAYGLLRFVVPLFRQSAAEVSYVAMLLGVIGILYGAMLAFAQTDFKRFIAYSSLSHLGFILLGIFAWNTIALQGVVLQMIAHGVSTGALFILAGILETRLQTRDLRQMGGLWAVAPRMGGIGMFFALAALGLPGLGNFVGEFLILLGAFKAQAGLTIAATAGMIGSVIYALWMVQLIFQGPLRPNVSCPDLKFRELTAFAALIVALLWLGLYPNPVFNTVSPAVKSLTTAAPQTETRLEPTVNPTLTFSPTRQSP
ncbi:MAG TPA: NADH-quinone oxidoreductase subunit M [Armatimonadota bacterium]|nr:NADH-quinone oxidoreductase subunit M [Armatimonadota bacterium]